MLILRIAVPVPLYKLFDYLVPENYSMDDLIIGARVKISFGKRILIGILTEITQTSVLPTSQLKPILEILDTEAIIPANIFKLIMWASDYYHHPIGEVFACAMPALLRKGKFLRQTKKIATKKSMVFAKKDIQLNDQQLEVIQQVNNSLEKFQTFLLAGVTGSGKTEVYFEIVQQILQKKRQALILVPEIGLTPQIIARFEQHFPNETIASFHSNLTDKQRLTSWHSAKTGTASIVIGTRSAIFIPFKDLGIIIIDEEHDASFKQQEGFRYSARDLAIVRANFEKIPVLLGSATPSLESLHQVEKKRYEHLQLSNRAGIAIPPIFHCVDLRNKRLENGLSEELITHMQKHLSAGGQVLLFLNRRGFAPLLICHQCGWLANCKRCDAKLTLHQSPSLLHCHHCGATQKPNTACPECNNKELISWGIGTQRLEQTIQTHFPEAKIARLDRDTTRHKGNLQNILESIQKNESQILIGTQMLAKGHDFPNVTLVAILNADNGLYSSDFRASEKMAQLIIQVAGRAGRAERRGEVVIQTHNPDHPTLRLLLENNYSAFAQLTLAERKLASVPPYSYFAVLRAEAMHKSLALQFLETGKTLGEELAKNKLVAIAGPIPTLMEKKAGHYRAQLLFQSAQRAPLHQVLRDFLPRVETLPQIRRVRWTIDVDPLEVI